MNSKNVYSKVLRVRLVSYISGISWKRNSAQLCTWRLMRILFLALIFPIVGSGIVTHIASSYSKSVCEVFQKPDASSYVIIGHKTLCLLLWRGRVGGTSWLRKRWKIQNDFCILAMLGEHGTAAMLVREWLACCMQQVSMQKCHLWWEICAPGVPFWWKMWAK